MATTTLSTVAAATTTTASSLAMCVCVVTAVWHVLCSPFAYKRQACVIVVVAAAIAVTFTHSRANPTHARA